MPQEELMALMIGAKEAYQRKAQQDACHMKNIRVEEINTDISIRQVEQAHIQTQLSIQMEELVCMRKVRTDVNDVHGKIQARMVQLQEINKDKMLKIQQNNDKWLKCVNELPVIHTKVTAAMDLAKRTSSMETLHDDATAFIVKVTAKMVQLQERNKAVGCQIQRIDDKWFQYSEQLEKIQKTADGATAGTIQIEETITSMQNAIAHLSDELRVLRCEQTKLEETSDCDFHAMSQELGESCMVNIRTATHDDIDNIHNIDDDSLSSLTTAEDDSSYVTDIHDMRAQENNRALNSTIQSLVDIHRSMTHSLRPQRHGDDMDEQQYAQYAEDAEDDEILEDTACRLGGYLLPVQAMPSMPSSMPSSMQSRQADYSSSDEDEIILIKSPANTIRGAIRGDQVTSSVELHHRKK